MLAILLSYEVDWDSYTIVDYLYSPFLIIIILIAGYLHQKKKVEENPVYKYYLSGLAIKLFSAVVFLLLFTEYYGGGDTTDYMRGSISMTNLLFKSPEHYFSILIGKADNHQSWWWFDMETKWPPAYMWKNFNTRFVIALSSMFNLIGLKSFMPTTILVSAFSYLGVWKLYLFFTEFYPKLTKQMAIAVLFVPSVLFWGSGVMKDTYTFAASAWLVYNIYMIFFKKQKIPVNILLCIINVFIIISIKPYIFVALLPGIVIWALFKRIKDIKNKVLANITMPLMILVGFGITMFVFSALQTSIGTYGNVDEAIKMAQTIQQDLLRSEQYGSNSYYVGEIDGTLAGMLKIAPKSIIAGMYRPYIWEARNPVMLISGLENFALLLLTLYLLLKLKVIRFFQYIFSDPILIFSVLFTVFFMFAVGMASANFGALVRYKIPAMPFFVASIFIMLDKYKAYKKEQILI